MKEIHVGMLLQTTFVLLLTLQLASVFTDAFDGTRMRQYRGKQVTDAVLRRIQDSNIFAEDHSFLARVAFVETKFGLDKNTYRLGYHGGIWAVDEANFQKTKMNDTFLFLLYRKIENEFDIDWLQMQWSHLEVPLYSGLAAALYTTLISRKDEVPDTIRSQAQYWKRYYRSSGDINLFIEASKELRKQTTCRGKVDLCIVLDSSGSIRTYNYNIAKNFVAELIESFTLDYTRLGMLIYSDKAEDVFPMNNSFQISEMVNLIKNTRYIDSGTQTHLGINRAVKMFNEVPVIEGVPRLLFVFTDGNTNTPANLTSAVDNIREAGLISISVGIGNERDIQTSELELIALNKSKNVFRLTDFEALHDFLFQITSVVCETPQTVSKAGKVKDVIIKDETRLYEVKLPTKGITVTVNTLEGKIKGYWSYKERNPSEAIYDGKIDKGTFHIPYPKDSIRKHTKGGLSRQKRDIVNSNNSTVDTNENELGDEDSTNVYIAVQGVEESNNYTLNVENGDTTSGGPPSRMATPLIFSMVLLYCLFCLFLCVNNKI